MDWRSWEHRQLSLVGVAMQGWGLPTLSGLPPAQGKELARRLGIFHFEGEQDSFGRTRVLWALRRREEPGW